MSEASLIPQFKSLSNSKYKLKFFLIITSSYSTARVHYWSPAACQLGKKIENHWDIHSWCREQWKKVIWSFYESLERMCASPRNTWLLWRDSHNTPQAGTLNWDAQNSTVETGNTHMENSELSSVGEQKQQQANHDTEDSYIGLTYAVSYWKGFICNNSLILQKPMKKGLLSSLS